MYSDGPRRSQVLHQNKRAVVDLVAREVERRQAFESNRLREDVVLFVVWHRP